MMMMMTMELKTFNQKLQHQRTWTSRSRGGGRGRGRQSRGGRKTSSTVNQVNDDSMETSSVTMTTGNNTTFVGGQQSEEKGYFHHLLAGKTNIQVLVDQWIDSYQANRDEALIELMQFFLDSSGCKGKLTQTMYLKMEHVDMLRAMTEHFDEVKFFGVFTNKHKLTSLLLSYLISFHNRY